jgi:hypothetical protein
MQPPLVYKMSLTELQGEGEFACPCCGIIISPEDETNDVYTIVDTKVCDGELEELEIQCNKCQSKIRLTEFNAS